MKLKRTLLSQSLALAFAAAGLSVAVVSPAYAQSNSVGSIFGNVPAGGGDQVSIENTQTGVRRTIPVDGTRFSASAVAPGKYRVMLLKGGATVSTAQVEVFAGAGAEAVFTAGGAASLGTVVVTGSSSPIDVTSTANVTTFTADQLASLPFASQNFNAIIRLAPNTTSADPRYAGGVSIGGGAPSENAFYVDGFPVTNPLTQLGSMELPFGAIASASVQTGGFGAEFGRSVGGVFNVTTKSGTNEWHGGVNAYWEPDGLRAAPKTYYYPNTGDPNNSGTDGTVNEYRHKNMRSEGQYGAYIGGPIIENRLFFFIAADHTDTSQKYVSGTPDDAAAGLPSFVDQTDRNNRYFAKLDFNITDDHRLSAEVLGDNFKTTQANFGYDYDTHTKTTKQYTEYAKNLDNVTPQVGGDAQVLRYVGNITSDFTVTALAGASQYKHDQSYDFLPTAPTLLNTPASVRNPNLLYPTINPLPGGTTGIADGAEDKTQSFRLDLEYKLGDHTIRAGADDNKLKSANAGDTEIGGVYYRYYGTAAGGTTPSISGDAVPVGSVVAPVNGRYYYVRQRYFSDTTNAKSDQTAEYLEDTWNITNTVMVRGGIRDESFKNKNGDGDTFLKSDNFISPRLSASWDTFGDSSLKVFGSAGRYSLQIPTHVAVRGASASTYTDQYFGYTGVDPTTGAPTGLTPLGSIQSPDNEFGQSKNAKTVSADNIKPTYQDEVTLGFEKLLMQNVNVGITATGRKLKDTIDDDCDQRPFDAYAAAHGIDESNYGGFNCATYNPGKSNTFFVDYAGTNQNLTKVKLSKADLGEDTAKRTYLAVDFFVEHAFADNWYGKFTYTWSQSRGNTEGQTKSDNAQSDVSVTSTWDFPELGLNSYGNLPNDRKHQFKGYGYYQLFPEVGFGATAVAEAGRPKNCIGYLPPEVGDSLYGGQYFYCDGLPSPRGSAGHLPWNYSLDLNAIYKPSFVKGLQLRIDVFNVFNRQSETVVDEYRDVSGADGGYQISPTYGQALSYSAPRVVRLSAQYDF